MIGWRPLSTMGDAAQDSGEPRLHFSICFCVVSRSEAGSYSSGTWSDGSEAMERRRCYRGH